MPARQCLREGSLRGDAERRLPSEKKLMNTDPRVFRALPQTLAGCGSCQTGSQRRFENPTSCPYGSTPFYTSVEEGVLHGEVCVYIRVVAATSFLILAGRAWEHLVWSVPYTALLWDQSLMEPVVRLLLGISWETYAELSHPYIMVVHRVVGWILLAAAAAAATSMFSRGRSSIRDSVILTGGVCLIFVYVLKYLDHNMDVAQAIEHTSQWIVPFLLVWILRNPPHHAITRLQVFVVVLAVASTFIGHALYLVGFHAMPGHFIDMTIDGFGLSESTTREFLWYIGIADIVAALLLFLPASRYTHIPKLAAVAYCIIWGLMTSVARPYTNWDDISDVMTTKWILEFLVRTSHYSLPALLFIYWWRVFARRA